jgi:hypothetical protein
MQTLRKPYANPMNYHNEHEPKTAAWLRCLIEDGLLPPAAGKRSDSGLGRTMEDFGKIPRRRTRALYR